MPSQHASGFSIAKLTDKDDDGLLFLEDESKLDLVAVDIENLEVRRFCDRIFVRYSLEILHGVIRQGEKGELWRFPLQAVIL